MAVVGKGFGEPSLQGSEERDGYRLIGEYDATTDCLDVPRAPGWVYVPEKAARILFLVDRNILADQAKTHGFKPTNAGQCRSTIR